MSCAVPVTSVVVGIAVPHAETAKAQVVAVRSRRAMDRDDPKRAVFME
jgi:hypothetical protein